MLNPAKVALDRAAFSGQMILVGVTDAFAYADGHRTDTITAVRCTVVLPDYSFEQLAVKLPVGTAVNESLLGKPVDFTDFFARVYSLNGRMGLSASATSVAAAKG